MLYSNGVDKYEHSLFQTIESDSDSNAEVKKNGPKVGTPGC